MFSVVSAASADVVRPTALAVVSAASAPELNVPASAPKAATWPELSAVSEALLIPEILSLVSASS